MGMCRVFLCLAICVERDGPIQMRGFHNGPEQGPIEPDEPWSELLIGGLDYVRAVWDPDNWATRHCRRSFDNSSHDLLYDQTSDPMYYAPYCKDS